MLTAITRKVSSALGNCELSFVARKPIDLETARAQHHAYEELLATLGARVVSLPVEPELPAEGSLVDWGSAGEISKAGPREVAGDIGGRRRSARRKKGVRRNYDEIKSGRDPSARDDPRTFPV